MIWLRALAVLFLSQGAFTEEISFEKAEIKVGDKVVHAKIADNDERREHGLMFVKKLGANEGMLFVFEDERVQNFWMKNTVIPLSIGFFDEQGRLIDVQEMKPSPSLMDKDPPTYKSSGTALFVLEMPEGWFKKNHVEVGAVLSIPHPPKSALLKQKVHSPTRQTSSGNSH